MRKGGDRIGWRGQADDALLDESADLLYHLIVLLRARGLSLADAVTVLEARHR